VRASVGPVPAAIFSRSRRHYLALTRMRHCWKSSGCYFGFNHHHIGRRAIPIYALPASRRWFNSMFKPMKSNKTVRSVLALFGVSALFATFSASAAQGPQPSGICTRACWTARAPKCGIATMGALNRAVIHHTAGAGDYTTDYNTGKARVRAAQNLHMDSNGWCDIAYHFLVNAGGDIYEGRSGSMSGQPKGSHDGCNTDSFGFTLLGYYHTPYNQLPTGESRDRLYKTIAWRMPSSWSPYGSSTYCGGSVGRLAGHLNVKATACPGSTMYNPYITSNVNGGEARDRVNSYKNNGSIAQGNRVGIARTANGGGYWIAASDGGVFSFGNAVFYGSWGGQPLNKPVVGIAARPQGDGYWLVASDGGIFCFGAAGFHGSLGGITLNQPIVGIAATQSGNGYWMLGKDGGVFCFGDAPFHGSQGGSGLLDFVGIAGAYHSNGSNGYWLVRATGSIYSYNASYFGGGDAGSGITGFCNYTDSGYIQVRNNGNIYGYNNVCYNGGANESTFVGIARGPSNCGYWIVKSDGAVFSFGDAQYHGGANF
jgi:hypothetical protein